MVWSLDRVVLSIGSMFHWVKNVRGDPVTSVALVAAPPLVLWGELEKGVEQVPANGHSGFPGGGAPAVERLVEFLEDFTAE